MCRTYINLLLLLIVVIYSNVNSLAEYVRHEINFDYHQQEFHHWSSIYISPLPTYPNHYHHYDHEPHSNSSDIKTTNATNTQPGIHNSIHIKKNETLDNQAEAKSITSNHSNVPKFATNTDSHQYYNSTISDDPETGKRYWVDLDNHPNVHINTLLSNSYRQATTINLKFEFPFYGNKIYKITVTTGGFLYTGDMIHKWLSATQYIAPLMANFDTSSSKASQIKYADNGMVFTVEWKNVRLRDKPEVGEFTFQVSLRKNGDIIFVYPNISGLEIIDDKKHPVKIGTSDAYVMDILVFFARHKTLYEYQRINFNRQDIHNWTSIYLKALPTCEQMDNCHSCLTEIKNFDCKWCPEAQKCSTGTSRFEQMWLESSCDVVNVKEVDKCPVSLSVTHHEQKNKPVVVSNKTLHNPVIKNFITDTDDHKYYNSTFNNDPDIGKKYWIDLDHHPKLQTIVYNVSEPGAIIQLKFDFPFYDHKIRRVAISPDGVLVLGEIASHSVQEIAPLKSYYAMFENGSMLRYVDNDSTLIVEWKNLKLQKCKTTNGFTFQAILRDTGDITFVYANLPISLKDAKEPYMKINIADQ